MKGNTAALLVVGSITMAGLIAIAACSEPVAQTPSVDLGISPTPPTVGNARIVVTVNDSLGAPLAGARVVLQGRPEESDAVQTERSTVEESPGHYVVPDFRFPAAGPWTVDVVVAVGTDEPVRISRSVRVVGGPF